MLGGGRLVHGSVLGRVGGVHQTRKISACGSRWLYETVAGLMPSDNVEPELELRNRSATDSTGRSSVCSASLCEAFDSTERSGNAGLSLA